MVICCTLTGEHSLLREFSQEEEHLRAERITYNNDLNVAAEAIIPYFFSYKMDFFSFQNNPKNLDPSYKMDLDLWSCLKG